MFFILAAGGDSLAAFVRRDDIEGFDRYRPPGAGRSLTIQYSHLFDLLN